MKAPSIPIVDEFLKHGDPEDIERFLKELSNSKAKEIVFIYKGKKHKLKKAKW